MHDHRFYESCLLRGEHGVAHQKRICWVVRLKVEIYDGDNINKIDTCQYTTAFTSANDTWPIFSEVRP